MWLLAVIAIFSIAIFLLAKRKESRNSVHAEDAYVKSSKEPPTDAVQSVSHDLADITVNILDLADSKEYLAKNEITKADTILFSCFILRYALICNADDRLTAKRISDEYVASVIKSVRSKVMLSDTFYEMFDNRMQFYDRIIAKNPDPEKKFSALVAEFEYIIKTDIINGRYVPFSENSPLPILGFDIDMACEIEVATFFRTLVNECL